MLEFPSNYILYMTRQHNLEDATTCKNNKDLLYAHASISLCGVFDTIRILQNILQTIPNE